MSVEKKVFLLSPFANFQLLGVIIVSTLFSLYLANLPIDQFVDRQSYISYANYATEILVNRYSQGIFTLLFNEPMWGGINVLLTFIFGVDLCLRLIIFFSTFITSYFVLINTKPEYLILSILFLLLPQVIKNNIIHLRQGLAISFFIWGWFTSNTKLRNFMYFSAALTHSSFIIVLSGMFLINLTYRFNIANDLRVFVFTSFSLFTGAFSLSFAAFFGARQAENYELVSSATSGFGFVFWLGILIIFLMQGRDFFFRNTTALFFLLLYLGTYFFLPVSGRILESVLLIILMAGQNLKRDKKVMFILAYFFYFVLTWSFRLSKPGFGWDIVNYQ